MMRVKITVTTHVASNVDRKITHMHLSINICVGTNIYCSSYYVSSYFRHCHAMFTPPDTYQHVPTYRSFSLIFRFPWTRSLLLLVLALDLSPNKNSFNFRSAIKSSTTKGSGNNGQHNDKMPKMVKTAAIATLSLT